MGILDAPAPTRAELSGTYSEKENRALGLLFAGLASSSVTACNVVFTGSSSTAGSNATADANRYVNRLVSAMQAAFPAPGGTEAATIAHTESLWGTISTTPGVHGYNGGQGGTGAANYMNDTEAAAIMSVNPAMVLHMIGSNDVASNVDPAVYKANVQDRVNKLISLSSKPFLQVLVHSYPRFDVTGIYPWADYGKALKEVADASTNVIFVDLSGYFLSANIPGSDPYNIIDTDNVHPNDAGHKFLGEMLFRALRLPAPKQTAAASTAAVRTTARITSDTFSGANVTDIGGRVSDAGLGGSAKTWAKDTTDQVAVTNGVLVRGPGTLNNFTANIPETTMNLEIAFTLVTVPVGDNLLIDLHRQLPVVAGTPDVYRVVIAIGGALSISKRVGGGSTTLASGSTAAAGDRIAFRTYKGALEVRKNGVLVLTATDTAITAPGHAGISGTAALTAFGMDDLTIDAVT